MLQQIEQEKATEKAHWLSFINALGFRKDKTSLEANGLNQATEMLRMRGDLQPFNFGIATAADFFFSLVFIFFQHALGWSSKGA